MPIRREIFEKGRIISEEEQTILRLLTGNNRQAFTIQEISSALGYSLKNDPWSILTMFRLQAILDSMVRSGTITKRQISSAIEVNDYYASNTASSDEQ